MQGLLFRYAKLIRMVPKIGTAYQLQYLTADIIVISAMLAISYNTILIYNNGQWITLITHSFGEIRVIGNMRPIKAFLLRDLLYLVDILKIG